jgi:hypothetical protein
MHYKRWTLGEILTAWPVIKLWTHWSLLIILDIWDQSCQVSQWQLLPAGVCYPQIVPDAETPVSNSRHPLKNWPLGSSETAMICYAVGVIIYISNSTYPKNGKLSGLARIWSKSSTFTASIPHSITPSPVRVYNMPTVRELPVIQEKDIERMNQW